MSSPPIFAKPSVVVNGGDYRVERIKMTIAMNTVPSVVVAAVKSTRATVYRPTSAVVVDDIRERQQKRLAGKTEPDISMVIQDGRNSTLNFKGYLAAPILELSETAARDQFSVIGEDSALDGLDMSFYKAGSKFIRADEKNSLLPLPASKDGDVSQLAYEVTAVLEKNFNVSLLDEQDENQRALLTRQHQLNSGTPSLVWLHILQNSKGQTVYDSWARAAAETNSIEVLSSQMTRRMVELIQQKTSGFWTCLNGIMAAFQLCYKPATEGSGSLMRVDKKVSMNAEKKVVHPSIMSLSDGSSRIMQLGGVVLAASAQQNIRPDEKNQAPQQIYAQYPNPALPGYIHKDSPPSWLLNEGVPVVPSELTAAVENRYPSLNLLDLASRLSGGGQASTVSAAELNNISRGVMTEYCKVLYDSLRLADSTAELTIPLDVSYRVGERYQFVNGLGDPLFTGFLNGVIHSIDLREGRELDTFTQLSITHTQY